MSVEGKILPYSVIESLKAKPRSAKVFIVCSIFTKIVIQTDANSFSRPKLGHLTAVWVSDLDRKSNKGHKKDIYANSELNMGQSLLHTYNSPVNYYSQPYQLGLALSPHYTT